MITVMRKMITVIKKDDSDILLSNHRNQILNHCNQFISKKSRGQGITEYAVFITMVVMALLAMQIYLKRGVQGKIKDIADQISPTLYSPNTSVSEYKTDMFKQYRSVYERGSSNYTVVLDQANTTGYIYGEAESVQ